jgi:outer membrane receptor protein involved in Fe transport
MRSVHGSYYACAGKGASYFYFRSAKPTTCYAPVGSWRDQVKNTHLSHELRFTTDQDYRLRALAGAYYEKFSIYDDMNFNYMGIPQCNAQNLAASAAGGPDCVTTVGPIAGYYSSTPGYRTDTNTAFGEDVLRGYSQFAFFATVDFDIIPKVLTVSAGERHYDYKEFETGSEYYSATSTVLNVPNGTCTHCGFGMNLNKSESGWKPRFNVSWHVLPDLMAYYTYSQGFRPGGFNRTASNPDGTVVHLKGEAPYTSGDNQYLKPEGYDSDTLTNNEIGIKSEWLNHRLIANISAYQMDWKNVQIPLFDPTQLGNTTFVVNGPTYRIQGSSSWNSSQQTDAPCLDSAGVTPGTPHNPTPAGECITQVKGAFFNNPFGSLGTRAPFSPAIEFNLRARYDWATNGYNYFAWAGANHIGTMENEPASFPDGNSPGQNPPNTTLLRYQIPGYTTYDASVGVAKDAWTAAFTANNLSNSDAVSNISSGQFIKAEVPIRPRVFTFSLGYKF